MKNKRIIGVVTGSRAEYGIWKPLIKGIQESQDLMLDLYVTGMHLLTGFGDTKKEITKDGFKIIEVPMYSRHTAESAVYYNGALIAGIKNFSKLFNAKKPDLLCVLGDRLEPLAAVLAALFFRLPILHLNGGERTESLDIDESIRHSITRFAHMHLVATEESRNRLLAHGEEAWRIKKVGALSIDGLNEVESISKKEVLKSLEFAADSALILCLFHPLHLWPEKSGQQMREIMQAILKTRIPTVIVYPNNDAGSADITAEIKRHARNPLFRIFKSLPHDDFIRILRVADVFVGNSSSGIIEAPTLRVPFVNVGGRQMTRERGSNVIDARPDSRAILAAIKKSLGDEKFLGKVKKGVSPYGNGRTAEKILEILRRLPINDRLLAKRITF